MHSRRCSECAARLRRIDEIEAANPLMCGLGNEPTRGIKINLILQSICEQINRCEQEEMDRWEREWEERARQLEAQGYKKTWDFDEREYVWVPPTH